jgi:putative type I restriction modification DNA specificity domain protein
MHKIADYTELITKGTTPTTIGLSFEDEGINFIKIESITDRNTIDLNSVAFISDECNRKMKRSQLREGDLLLSIAGNIGRMAVVDNSILPANTNQAIGIIRFNGMKVNPYFIKYLFSTNWYRSKIINANAQSVQKNINLKNIGDLEVDLPNIEQQNKIVGVLKRIDDKVENNNKIDAKLEELAKAIYSYWFLQFNFPNENRTPYKSSGEKMAWSNDLRREIPNNWKVNRIRDVINHINTGLNPRQNFILNTGNIKYITVKNLTTKGTIDFTTCDTIDEEALAKVHRRSDISKGDILFASIAPLGRCVIIREDPMGWDINESVFSIRPKNRNLSEYLYMFFMSEYFIKKAEYSSTGSVFRGIRISVLEDMKIVVPPENVLDEFSKTISPILDLKYQNEMENQKLKEIRDFLLPLLMNGQARIIE